VSGTILPKGYGGLRPIDLKLGQDRVLLGTQPFLTSKGLLLPGLDAMSSIPIDAVAINHPEPANLERGVDSVVDSYVSAIPDGDLLLDSVITTESGLVNNRLTDLSHLISMANPVRLAAGIVFISGLYFFGDTSNINLESIDLSGLETLPLSGTFIGSFFKNLISGRQTIDIFDTNLIQNIKDLRSRLGEAGLKKKERKNTIKSLFTYHEQLTQFFKDIDLGKREQPEGKIYAPIVRAYITVIDALFKHLLETNPSDARKLFWNSYYQLNRVVYSNFLLENLGGDNDRVASLLASYFDLLWTHVEGKEDENDIARYESILEAMRDEGILASESSVDHFTLPPEELFIWGTSRYSKDILEPAFEKGFNYVKAHAPSHVHEELKEILARILAIYQKIRAANPHAPAHIAIIAAINNYIRSRSDHEGQQLNRVKKNLIGDMYSVVTDIERALATLPTRQFESHRSSIARDFPNSLHFRAGLAQTIDAEAIEKTLQFPTKGEELIMHIGVDGDLELIKESLNHLTPNGKVVVVDIDPKAFEPLYEDEITDTAIDDGRLILETTDYHGDNSHSFRAKYDGAVTRAYLLHPVGDPAPVMHDVVAPNGIVIYQLSENADQQRYLGYDTRMFIDGDFEKVVGYGNGPSQFKTNTANNLSHAGIRFSIARRNEESDR